MQEHTVVMLMGESEEMDPREAMLPPRGASKREDTGM